MVRLKKDYRSYEKVISNSKNCRKNLEIKLKNGNLLMKMSEEITGRLFSGWEK